MTSDDIGRRFGRALRPAAPVGIVDEVVDRLYIELDPELPGHEPRERGFVVRHQPFEVRALGNDARSIARGRDGAGRERRRVDPAAHGDADPTRRQAVADRMRHQLDKPLGIGCATFEIERFAKFEMPVATRGHGRAGHLQQMGGRKPLHGTINRPLDVETGTRRQEIGDPLLVVFAIDRTARERGADDPVEQIAEDQNAVSLGMEEGTHT